MAGRRHVLILVENLPVPFDRRVWQEAKALVGAGYEVSVICPMGKGHFSAYEVIDGVHIYRHVLREARSAKGYVREYASALYHQLRLSLKVRRRRPIGVIQACNPPDLMFSVALFHKLLFGTRFVFDHHDLCPELYVAKYGRKDLAYRVLKALEKLTFRAADASIATNEVFRDIAIDRGGMAPERVTVVKSFPEPSKFRRTAAEPSLLAMGKHLVGFVGIMGEQDGVDALVRAMAILRHRKKREDIHCVLIGEGPELSRLRTLADALEVRDSITFTGYLSGPALTAHLSALCLGVIPDPPNEFNDKLSMNKVFEYMMLGLPFVQFNLRQAAREAGEAALVLDDDTPEALAGGIVDLIDDPMRRKRMSLYGLSTAHREFRWSAAEANYLAAYQAVLDPEPLADDQRHYPASRARDIPGALPGVAAVAARREGIV